jgi:hypothetical protein
MTIESILCGINTKHTELWYSSNQPLITEPGTASEMPHANFTFKWLIIQGDFNAEDYCAHSDGPHKDVTKLSPILLTTITYGSHGTTLKMEEAATFETLQTFYPTTQYHIP